MKQYWLYMNISLQKKMFFLDMHLIIAVGKVNM